MTVGEDLVQHKKHKSHIVFIGKNYYNLMASLSRLEVLFLDVSDALKGTSGFFI